MNREDYQKVKKIFQSALDIAPDERAEYLNEKCSDNPNIRREVEKLLSSFDSGYLEHPAIEKFAESIVVSNLSIGQEIGHYKIIKKIGAGGMGEVFLAEDVRLKRKVALKILPTAFSQDKNYLRRFEQEACAASALNHPNIVTVHEFGGEDGTNFIATEFVEGKTLREFVRTACGSGRVSVEKQSTQNANLNPPATAGGSDLSKILDIVLQVAAALSAAHDAGIVHRDIKPENVMIRADGLVKVLDFGLAKRALQSVESQANLIFSHNTEPGMMMGTVAYMSPEQTQGKTIDIRTDLWSFGIVLSEMLTGDQPFRGESKVDTITMILTEDPSPPDESIPEKIRQIVTKCLAKKTNERYQTVRDLLIDLKDAKHDLELHDKLERSTVPEKEANKTQSLPESPTNKNQNQLTKSAEFIVTQVKKTKFIYLTIVVLAVAVIGFGIYKYSGNQPTNIPFESVKITKITDSGNVGEAVAISRDGKWLVYSIGEKGQASVWLKQVAIPESNTQIVPPAAVKYRAFTFSPDGNYLYYSVEGEPMSNCTVYQMPLLGNGTARKLISGINGGISFSPDGKQITYGVENLADDESILMVANADGSEPRELVKLKGNDEIGSSRGRWSPDGKQIAITRGSETSDVVLITGFRK